MRMKFTMCTLTTLVLVLSLFATGAQAVTVTNTTTGTTIFSDGFEGVTPTGGDDDPVAAIGTWNITEPNVGTDIAAITGGSPGAFEGSNYLQIHRSGSGGGTRNDFFAAFSAAPLDGENIHVEWMNYMQTGTSLADQIIFALSRGDSAIGDAIVTFWNNDTTDADGVPNEVWSSNAGPGWGANQDTGLRFTFDTWEKWELDYTANAATATLTVAGNSVVWGVQTSNQGIPLSMEWRAQMTGQTSWIDGVPEPASLSLVCLGGLLMLKRRRHQA